MLLGISIFLLRTSPIFFTFPPLTQAFRKKKKVNKESRRDLKSINGRQRQGLNSNEKQENKSHRHTSAAGCMVVASDRCLCSSSFLLLLPSFSHHLGYTFHPTPECTLSDPSQNVLFIRPLAKFLVETDNFCLA